MGPFDPARVAELVVGRGTSYGSGYRIGSRLVLTAAHLFDRAGGTGGGETACTVHLGGDATGRPGTLVWRGDGHDIALVRLGGDAAPGTVPPVALGTLRGGVGRVPFTAVGFPAFAQRPASGAVTGLRRRDSRQIDGFVQLGSNVKSGLLDLSVTSAPPLPAAPGAGDPWQGMSGAALFVRDGTLLVGVQSGRLPAAGTGGAEAVALAAALDDPAFTDQLVLDGVRPLPVPVDPPDRPARDPLAAVLPQQEVVEGLGDFGRNLTPERLPFVSPGSTHEADPDNLFRRLVASADRGVLLVGAAGTGKTRTCMEVGRRALAAGWRVLHVLPGEDASVTDEVAERVFAEPGPVLVVVDYLNESLLDLPALRHRFIPEAHRRGVPVALLASVRPGWLRRADRALLHELFDEVALRQDEAFQQEVTDRALSTVAREAVDKLGMDWMLSVCGRRPIVALLIAQEIERRVAAGRPVLATVGLRSGGELAAWLERRLREDGLAVEGGGDAFTPARASPALVAAAAAVAACPQQRTEVTAAARAALAGAPEGSPAAEDIVATLVSLRWLEPGGPADTALSVAHDLVADQLVHSVVLPEPDAAPDRANADALLAGCLTHPRTLGRYAVTLGRLVNDLALAGSDGRITPVLDAWFAGHTAGIGRLVRTDSDVGGYALGALCSGPPWSAAAVRGWGEVVTPWLTDFGTGPNARHLLYKGLRYLPTEGAPLLVPTALAWLVRNGHALHASFVLGPLLFRTDLAPADAARAVRTAHSWLDVHGTAVEARFVHGPLLTRADPGSPEAAAAVAGALAWLETYGGAGDAQHVLGPLLLRPDLPPQDAERAVATAFAWLGARPGGGGWQFVLAPLLARAGLPPGDAARARGLAFAWLEGQGAADGSQFVLRPLLMRADLTAREMRTAVGTALAWLGEEGEAGDAQFVLAPLLARADLPPGEAARAVARARAWLTVHGALPQATFVLRPLLARADLGPGDAEHVVGTALGWLRDRTDAVEAQFVLAPLLARADLGRSRSARAVGTALTWLDRHGDVAEAQFVLAALLARTDLSPADAAVANRTALAWLDGHGDHADAGFVLRPLLARDDLAPDDARLVADRALTWARGHAHRADADFLLGALLRHLRREDIPPDVIGLVDTWVTEHLPDGDFTYLSKWVLRRRLMSPAVFDALLTWCRTHGDSDDLFHRMAGAGPAVAPYIRRTDRAYRWLDAVEACLDLAEQRGPAANVDGVLDTIICNLADCFTAGIAAARADDHIQRWAALPFAMNPSVFVYKAQIVRRCHAMILSGRYAPPDAEALARRLHTWISHWHTYTERTSLLAYITTHMLPAKD
ncbi:trypsin-like peptidase domain-containing protein [Streptomyces sp. MS19]|uniref:trypsin-like peptidase domain-containing protein n=1 Tax=Streptomyces sp. MS19 TaxID=3385972 RepID=UPI0039A2BE05